MHYYCRKRVREDGFLEIITEKGPSPVFFMHDHILRCHLFVEKSFLNLYRSDLEDDDEALTAIGGQEKFSSQDQNSGHEETNGQEQTIILEQTGLQGATVVNEKRRDIKSKQKNRGRALV